MNPSFGCAGCFGGKNQTCDGCPDGRVRQSHTYIPADYPYINRGDCGDGTCCEKGNVHEGLFPCAVFQKGLGEKK